MKLAISNIGWYAADDEKVYNLMKQYGFTGLELAPTVWSPEQPYEAENIKKAVGIASDVKQQYGLQTCSMQSIWYGRSEAVFGTEEEREALIAYTKQAIDYASALDIKNLVFGCPKSRNVPDAMTTSERERIELAFFRTIGDYAAKHGTCIGMEANPPIYNTNYVNGTAAALDLIRRVDSEGFRLNLDLGTMIYNEEAATILEGNAQLINHVHVSEPYLKAVEKRQLHTDIAALLRKADYQGYVSIEVGKNNLGENPVAELEDMMKYVQSIFA